MQLLPKKGFFFFFFLVSSLLCPNVQVNVFHFRGPKFALCRTEPDVMRGGSSEGDPVALQPLGLGVNCSKTGSGANLSLILVIGMGASAGANNLYFRFRSGALGGRVIKYNRCGCVGGLFLVKD